MVKTIARLFMLLGMLLVSAPPPRNVSAQAGSAYDLIAEVNVLRAASGLYALNVDSALMAAAQGHADWMAATGQGGHTGAGGSLARDRAIAAGYGGGQAVEVNENWAGGMDLSIEKCVYVFWNDPDHMGNMLTTQHVDIGAGVGIDGDKVYYVLNVGHVVGGALPPTVRPAGTQDLTAIPIIPLQTVTPYPDGSIVHVVGYGQSLWSIAIAYGMKIAEILALNGLSQDTRTVYVGQKLLVREAQSPTITPTITLTPRLPTRTPTPRQPTRTPRPTRTHAVEPTPAPIQPTSAPGLKIPTDRRAIGIGLVAACGIGLVLVGFFGFRKKSR
jgi:uncharacterized protein YkwD